MFYKGVLCMLSYFLSPRCGFELNFLHINEETTLSEVK